MKKIISHMVTVAFVIIMMPSMSHGGAIFDPNAFEVDCSKESHLSPLYNAAITSKKFLGSDGTSDYFLLKIKAEKVRVLKDRKSHLRVFTRKCYECREYDIGTLEGGSELTDSDVFSISVDTDAKEALVGFKIPRDKVGSDTTIRFSFYYCSDWYDRPFTTDEIKLCNLVDDERSNCPPPETAEPQLPDPFLGAGTKIKLSNEDEAHVDMEIKITSDMMHIVEGEPLDYITVWRTYDEMTSRNFSKTKELIGNTLRITVPGQLKNRFTGTSFKIIYENPNANPPRYFEYHIEKMCSLVVNEQGEKHLPVFCVAPYTISPIPIQMETPPSD